MRFFALLAALALLGGCGADGEPVPPTRDATITLSDPGLSAQTRVGFGRGPVQVSLGLGL